MTVIYVVEHQEDGMVIQYGFALTKERAEEACEALYRRKGGNRLDQWVEPYRCKDNEYTAFDW